MPKHVSPTSANAMESLLREFASRLEALVQKQVAEQLEAAVNEALRRRGTPKPTASLVARPKRMCPVPGCQNPAAGPKYNWRCREHKAVTKEQIARQKADSAVPVKRLPPGPRPDGQRRAGPPMDCRYPGCTVKSRGPRYNYFCGEHYKQLTHDEQKQYAEQWKLARAQKAQLPPKAAEPTVLLRRGHEVKPVESRPETESVPAAPPGEAS